jgi:aminoglycoside 6'-N-acetyltransferase
MQESCQVYDVSVTSLRGDRVLLRPAVPGDIPTLESIRREPSVERWWGLLEEGEIATDIAEGDGRILAVEVAGAVIGSVQWYEEKEPAFRHAGMDIYLTSGTQGQGIGAEVVRLLATWLIRDRDFHRLVIDPAAANERAIAAYAKVGFKPAGVLRRSWRAPDGTWEDQLLMDLLADELR